MAKNEPEKFRRRDLWKTGNYLYHFQNWVFEEMMIHGLKFFRQRFSIYFGHHSRNGLVHDRIYATLFVFYQTSSGRSTSTESLFFSYRFQPLEVILPFFQVVVLEWLLWTIFIVIWLWFRHVVNSGIDDCTKEGSNCWKIMQRGSRWRCKESKIRGEALLDCFYFFIIGFFLQVFGFIFQKNSVGWRIIQILSDKFAIERGDLSI